MSIPRKVLRRHWQAIRRNPGAGRSLCCRSTFPEATRPGLRWSLRCLTSLCYTTETMSPEPQLPWYQFSLRSLLLLTAFAAVVCSIGVYTHWLVSAVIGATVMIGGVAGKIVAGTRSGFVQGVV